jgi:hypothetical protein
MVSFRLIEDSAAFEFENGFTSLKYVLGQGSHHLPVGIIPAKRRRVMRCHAHLCATLLRLPFEGGYDRWKTL